MLAFHINLSMLTIFYIPQSVEIQEPRHHFKNWLKRATFSSLQHPYHQGRNYPIMCRLREWWRDSLLLTMHVHGFKRTFEKYVFRSPPNECMELLRCTRNDVLHALMYLPHCSCDLEFTSGKEPASLTWPESAHSKATSEKRDGLSKLDGSLLKTTTSNKGKVLLINEQKLSKYPNKNNKVQV